MKVEDMTTGAFRLRVENDKDLSLLKAFLHLDHFVNSYDDASLGEVINMIATDSVDIEEHMVGLSHEVAGDSTFDDGIIDDQDIMEAV